MKKLYTQQVRYPLLVFSALIPLLWFMNNSHDFLWQVSWYAVFILMTIRPMAELFPSQKWIRQLLPYRKELGIVSASVVITNALYNYIPLGLNFFPRYFSFQFWDFTSPIGYGRLAELAGLILLVTSNTISQKLLKKNWKRIQKLSYIYYYGAAILLVSYGKTDVLITASITFLASSINSIRNFNSQFALTIQTPISEAEGE